MRFTLIILDRSLSSAKRTAILAFLYASLAVSTMAGADRISLLFKAQEGSIYALDFTTNLSEGTVWSTLTNIPAASERDVKISLPGERFEMYFRVTGFEPPVTHIAPPKFAGTFANSRGGFGSIPVDYQEYFNRSNFFNLPAGEMVVSGIRFRVDESSPKIDVVIPFIRISLSTTPKSPRELFKIRRENWGADRKTVFSGTNVHIQAVRNLADPTEFGISIQFQSPFPYDYRNGSLLMDIATSGEYLGTEGAYDAVVNDDGSVIRIGEGSFGEPYISYGGNIVAFEFARVPLLRINESDQSDHMSGRN